MCIVESGMSEVNSKKPQPEKRGVRRVKLGSVQNMSDDDETEHGGTGIGRGGRHCGSKIEHPQIAVGNVSDDGNRDWCGVRRQEAQDEWVSRAGCFAAVVEEIFAEDRSGREVKGSGNEKKEISVWRNAGMIGVDGLNVVAKRVDARANGLIAIVGGGPGDANGADECSF